MKILYAPVMDDNLPASCASDYQSDTLFHGLRSIYGSDVIETPFMWWMYKDEVARRKDEIKQIWGKGFSVYGLLNAIERINIDCEYCIIPIHHTNILNGLRIYDHILSILKRFNGKIAVVDGWDRPEINPSVLELCRNNGIKYFKRELYDNIPDVYPITFAIPKEKIKVRSKNFFQRNLDIAPLIPVNQSIDPSFMSTYIYETEEDYYNMYEDSVFALTSKKGGWDTMRHYEIMANGCIPIFVDIELCPKNCLWNFPKMILRCAKRIEGLSVNTSNSLWHRSHIMEHCGSVDIDKPGAINTEVFNFDDYYTIRRAMEKWILTHGTTEALAKYVMDKINED